MIFAHGEGAGVAIVVCYDRRAQNALISSYRRLKFVLQCVDFWAPYKIGEFDREVAPCGAVRCRAGRGERDGRGAP